MLIGPPLLTTSGNAGRFTLPGCENLGLSEGVTDGIRRLFQGGAGRGSPHSLANKASRVHLDVAGQNHNIRSRNFIICQGILGTNRTLGFDPDPVTRRFRCGGQCLGSHKGMGNPGGARRNGNDPFARSGAAD